MDDIKSKIEEVELLRAQEVAHYQKRIDGINEIYNREVEKLYEQCDHDFSLWYASFYGNGHPSCTRVCHNCAKREVISFERYVKESQ